MKAPILGQQAHGKKALRLDVSQMMTSRLLLCADSGMGKSYALRALCEVLYGVVPVVVLDTEGEFASLREKGDYLLVGANGELPVPTSAGALLARRLVEVGTNAVVDLYDLTRNSKSPVSRQAFVASFLNGLLSLPKALWKPLVVVIDEAQDYAPESGKDLASKLAMADFSAQARKRGFCPVYATNRIGRIDKDAIAGFRNYLIGGTALDVDNKRAAALLGFDAAGAKTLRSGLEPGDFFAFGPALAREVTRVHIRQVETTHPRPGHPMPPVPAPPDRVKKLVKEFEGLPAEAKREVQTLEAAKAEIAKLQGELKMAMKKVQVEVEVEEKFVFRKGEVERLAKSLNGAIDRLETLTKHRAKMIDREAQAQQVIVAEIGSAMVALGKTGKTVPGKVSTAIAPPMQRPVAAPRPVPRALPPSTDPNGKLPAGERAVLVAIAQYTPTGGIERDALSVLTGYVRQTRDTYVSRLTSKGFVVSEGRGSKLVATAEGVQAAMPFDQIPSGGDSLRQFWRSRLPAGERAIFDVLIEAGADGISRDAITELTGYVRQTRDAYISRMSSKKVLVTNGRGGAVTAAPALLT